MSSDFVNARQEWEQTARPMANFRSGRTAALTYGIECDLDHQLSYINTMLQALSEWNPHWDFALRARRELRDLADFEDRIEALELPAEEAEPLLLYTGATKQLLQQILMAAEKRQDLGH